MIAPILAWRDAVGFWLAVILTGIGTGLAFLKKIDRETPKRLDLHLIADNYATHKTPEVKRWLEKHKRFTMHFTPTSCSWLNMVERLFAEITRQRIRRGTFNSVDELEKAITDWIEHRNQNPKPFVWTATAKYILAKHRRAKRLSTVYRKELNE
jgi:transposase